MKCIPDLRHVHVFVESDLLPPADFEWSSVAMYWCMMAETSPLVNAAPQRGSQEPRFKQYLCTPNRLHIHIGRSYLQR